jgi:hypothetical protein
MTPAQIDLRLIDDFETLLDRIRTDYGIDPTDHSLKEADNLLSLTGVKVIFLLFDLGLPDSTITRLLRISHVVGQRYRTAYDWWNKNPVSNKNSPQANQLGVAYDGAG